MRQVSLLFLLYLITLPVSATTVFQCEDEQGNRSFYDRCPPGTTAVDEKKFNVGIKKEPEKISATLYFVPNCSPCDMVKEFFELRKIPLTEKNVNNNIDLQKELSEKTGGLKVPTVVINDTVINGYNRDEMMNALKATGYKDPFSKETATEGAKNPPPSDNTASTDEGSTDAGTTNENDNQGEE